jgi:hypothetical protein
VYVSEGEDAVQEAVCGGAAARARAVQEGEGEGGGGGWDRNSWSLDGLPFYNRPCGGLARGKTMRGPGGTIVGASSRTGPSSPPVQDPSAEARRRWPALDLSNCSALLHEEKEENGGGHGALSRSRQEGLGAKVELGVVRAWVVSRCWRDEMRGAGRGEAIRR